MHLELHQMQAQLMVSASLLVELVYRIDQMRVGLQLVKGVITNWSAGEEGSGCTAEFGTAGISLSAKIDKIDDFGFVTFQLTPQLTAITGQFTNPTCNNALSSILSQRILETGRVRVQSGDTLLLTGVISDEDIATVTKWPLIGDIPIIGQFFLGNLDPEEKRIDYYCYTNNFKE